MENQVSIEAFEDVKKCLNEIYSCRSFSTQEISYVFSFFKTNIPTMQDKFEGFDSPHFNQLIKLFEYKVYSQPEEIQIPDKYSRIFWIIVDGTIEIPFLDEENIGQNRIFTTGDIITPYDLKSCRGPANELNIIIKKPTELFELEETDYQQYRKLVLRETVMTTLCKVFQKLKKLSVSNREDYITYFKRLFFRKGTVILTPRMRVKELYIVTKGRVIISLENSFNKKYPQSHIVFGVLEPGSTFNDLPPLFDKPCAYYAACTEDVEILSLEQDNIRYVADNETLNDLRAQGQSKERLLSVLIGKLASMEVEDIEKYQTKFAEKVGIKLQEIMQFFKMYNPKNSQSHHYRRNIDKFNKLVRELRKDEEPPEEYGLLDSLIEAGVENFDSRFKKLPLRKQRVLFRTRVEAGERRQGKLEALMAAIYSDPSGVSKEKRYRLEKVSEEEALIRENAHMKMMKKLDLENEKLLMKLGYIEPSAEEDKEATIKSPSLGSFSNILSPKEPEALNILDGIRSKHGRNLKQLKIKSMGYIENATVL